MAALLARPTPTVAPDVQPYKLGPQIGQGRFGRAYRATAGDGTPVCVKRILLNGRGLPPSVHQKQVDNEVTILRSLQPCPEVVRLVDVQPGLGVIDIVMELASCTLDEWQQGAPLREEVAAGVMAQVVRAIAACHARGVAFGDLKPQNVLLRVPAPPVEDGAVPAVALADFGCAQRMLQGGRARRSPGTPLYAAPEVWRQANGMEADVWSCGVLLYHLLAGGVDFPFFSLDGPALGFNEAFRAIASNAIDFSAPVWASVSPGAKQLIERMLDRDPATRISAVEALEHPWLRGAAAPAAPAPELALEPGLAPAA